MNWSAAGAKSFMSKSPLARSASMLLSTLSTLSPHKGSRPNESWRACGGGEEDVLDCEEAESPWGREDGGAVVK